MGLTSVESVGNYVENMTLLRLHQCLYDYISFKDDKDITGSIFMGEVDNLIDFAYRGAVPDNVVEFIWIDALFLATRARLFELARAYNLAL